LGFYVGQNTNRKEAIIHEINDKLQIINKIVHETISDKQYKTAMKALELLMEHSESQTLLDFLIQKAMEDKEYKVVIRAIDLAIGKGSDYVSDMTKLPTNKLQEILAELQRD
jgi:hypothetical protein